MASSLSNLVNNLVEGIHKINVNRDMIIKNKKTGGIKFKNCECCLKYTSFKDDSVEYKCLYCHKIYQKKV